MNLILSLKTMFFASHRVEFVKIFRVFSYFHLIKSLDINLMFSLKFGKNNLFSNTIHLLMIFLSTLFIL